MRAVYTVPGLLGAEHHEAEMRVLDDAAGAAMLVSITDIPPDALAAALTETYAAMSDEPVSAVNAHGVPRS